MRSTDRVTVIAEAGVNHQGDLSRALELVEVAASAGADFVKFQTFSVEDLALPTAPKAAYQRRTTAQGESQYEMLRQLQLSADDHWSLKNYAESCGIGFLSTPFDRRSLAFLVEDLGLGLIKLPSSDITNVPLLVDAGRSGASLILSTGMSTLGEVETALKAICFGLFAHAYPNSTASLDEIYSDSDARRRLNESVVLLHCTSEYPAAPGDANLRALKTLREAFDVPVGYSDHTQGIAVAVAATALGAVVVEKHLTLDKLLSGPDHSASSDPEEFSVLVRSVRDIEAALGSPVKSPVAAEMQNRRTMRKGMYAARDIPAGTVLSEADIAVLRPMTLVGPDEYFDWLGSIALRDIKAGDPLS